MWEKLPNAGINNRGRKVKNGATMLSKLGATRIHSLHCAETQARAPAPVAPVAAPGAAPPAAPATPEFDLEPLLLAQGYGPFPNTYRPTFREVKEVRKAISRTKVLIPWISPKSPTFINRDWDPGAASSAADSAT